MEGIVKHKIANGKNISCVLHYTERWFNVYSKEYRGRRRLNDVIRNITSKRITHN